MLNIDYNVDKVLYQDQKHTVYANVHKKIVSHLKCGPQIGVESVILLKEVVVLKPNLDKLYLNITLRNIVKV